MAPALAVLRESLAAQVALEGPLARVHAEVALERRHLAEHGGAHGALERAASRVQQRVPAQRGQLGEARAALPALVVGRAAGVVHLQVLGEGVPRGQRRAAQVALQLLRVAEVCSKRDRGQTLLCGRPGAVSPAPLRTQGNRATPLTSPRPGDWRLHQAVCLAPVVTAQ